MSNTRTKPELISYRQLRFIIGLTGFFLPVIIILGNCIVKGRFLLEESVSHYYHTAMGDVFVGLLCTVAIFLFTYKGHEKEEDEILSDSVTGNLACIFALGVAFFPTAETGAVQSTISWIHYICAGLFFCSLAYFCLSQFIKSSEDETKLEHDPKNRKLLRNLIYRICGYIILFAILMLLLYNAPAINDLVKETHYFIAFEILALWAFAFSWLVKAEVFFPDSDTENLA
ncbi:hypothetical protein ABGT15_13575 [Flavobacterium enshiense]|uniref:hypothetical protein n=1 Tax=Flavobacterium enshiense TaxID=1341165 RepID=UPI00345DE4F4